MRHHHETFELSWPESNCIDDSDDSDLKLVTDGLSHNFAHGATGHCRFEGSLERVNYFDTCQAYVGTAQFRYIWLYKLCKGHYLMSDLSWMIVYLKLMGNGLFMFKERFYAEFK